MTKTQKWISYYVALLGWTVRFIEFTPSSALVVHYHNPKIAGIKPVLEYCRDELDYELRLAAWWKAGTVQSPEYESFDKMLAGEIKRFKDL